MGDKSPRQQAKASNQKRAAAGRTRPGKRAVASPANTDPSINKFFRFRFNEVDLNGPWCLTSITPEDHHALIDFMREMESLLVREVIDGRRGKREDVAAASPNPDAQRRAQERYPDDHDRIHSLHLSGAKRIWGIQNENEFSVIWWDPNHEVWPTKRVYTN